MTNSHDTTSESRSILEKILDDAYEFQQTGRKFLTVFDLDSTLFDLTLRVGSIVDQFANEPEYQTLFPKECELLKTVKIERTDWGLGEPLGRIGLYESMNPHFFRELHQYWATCFFSDDFLHHDTPLPGAVEFVQELHETGAHIMYLTGRDIPRMKVGTEKSLAEHQFPLGGRQVRLILKPNATLDDAAFKVAILKGAEAEYEKIWLFENEPVNLNLTAKHCPNVGLVFIDSTHSGREQVADALDRIPHFEVNLNEFRNRRTTNI